MGLVYNFSIAFFELLLSFFSLFSVRIKKFLKPRSESFSVLNEKTKHSENYIWIHVASLGEYEQAVPVIQEIKKSFTGHKTVLSFFSNSGFDIIKEKSICDLTILLPLDTTKNAKNFIDKINPKMVFFVKYEFWPNYLNYLNKKNIPTYLVNGVFRNSHWFFKDYGKWFKKRLLAFKHFFVIDEKSEHILKKNGFKNSTLIGDSKFERVMNSQKRNNKIEIIEKFKGSRLCVVAGSTWKEDEKLFINYINSLESNNICFIIVPHQIHLKSIEYIKNSIKTKVTIMSQHQDIINDKSKVMIVDSVGLLTKIYSYADIAYVGGGMGKTGLHNTLEPAVFKIPVIIGNNFDKFNEVKKLVELGGITSICNQQEFDEKINEFINSKVKRANIGEINFRFIKNNLGASKKIIQLLNKFR
ncbi:MAG: 3-deoxy-D-manno-octulosonic acid transferase [Flavobacteriaceae bacterium]|nr:3-deoxy-D-manno-octulosonic acid transferase [Flavobacteriaceae bacterium]